ncbi:MAG: MlaA family lipoprotein [Planctomycetota bacterium]|jgi:phospholipid-binding lipoprotein MlaA
MKPQIWAIVILPITIAGCATSHKSPSAVHSGETQANREDALFHDNGQSEEFTDEDFEFLEEELAEKTVDVPDPLEPLNRLTFGVNDTLHFWVLEPCANAFKEVVPEPARLGIRNFFSNLTTPVRYVSCLLQGKGDAAGTELDRFLINTTVGILGFGDPAQDQYSVEPPPKEDLGQTLAVHGFDNGFYLVLPLLGPSTLRDSAGIVGGIFLNPVFYVEPSEAAIGISAGKNINERSFHVGEYENFKAAAVDPYVAMRQAYIQYRNKQIQE